MDFYEEETVKKIPFQKVAGFNANRARPEGMSNMKFLRFTEKRNIEEMLNGCLMFVWNNEKGFFGCLEEAYNMFVAYYMDDSEFTDVDYYYFKGQVMKARRMSRFGILDSKIVSFFNNYNSLDVARRIMKMLDFMACSKFAKRMFQYEMLKTVPLWFVKFGYEYVFPEDTDPLGEAENSILKTIKDFNGYFNLPKELMFMAPNRRKTNYLAWESYKVPKGKMNNINLQDYSRVGQFLLEIYPDLCLMLPAMNIITCPASSFDLNLDIQICKSPFASILPKYTVGYAFANYYNLFFESLKNFKILKGRKKGKVLPLTKLCALSLYSLTGASLYACLRNKDNKASYSEYDKFSEFILTQEFQRMLREQEGDD